MTNLVKEVSGKITEAHKTETPIEFIRHEYTVDEDTSYAVQEEVVKGIANLQGEIAGYKISMTSAETQAIAKTHEPAYGTLLRSNLLESGEVLSLSSMFSPLIEPEIMFILTEDLSPGADEEEILRKSEIAAGIEIPDSRYKDWFPNFSLADLICDNTAVGRVIVAESVAPPSFEELANEGMELFHNGVKIKEGTASAVLGNPVSAVAWLSRKLTEHKKVLKKGMLISSGTFISPIAAEEGTYRVSYSTLGQVEVTFQS
ncbi:2-keto-4-pentenoate hydratase [Planococcus salinarum]|uniref:2-keto-4-pentenoate hydratase n=1 Tax=Planococcus salinarum TaxID=622695 RepID=UPI000E3BB0AE|nr:2-keto-4-pentenoate hydratase [Planococcus salinarum]TAA71723.1 2-keto-4-pentenoate hydratase [Planococcus salinarum]